MLSILVHNIYYIFMINVQCVVRSVVSSVCHYEYVLTEYVVRRLLLLLFLLLIYIIIIIILCIVQPSKRKQTPLANELSFQKIVRWNK